MPAAESKSIPDNVFLLGDTVHVRHDLDYKPKMVVCQKVMTDAGNGRQKLDRVECFWFDVHGVYHRQGFDHLDLVVLIRAHGNR